VDLERIDQDLAAGAGRVRHGFSHPYRFCIESFYASRCVRAFEMATLNYRNRGAARLSCLVSFSTSKK
jgi:hypothetical protein